MKISELRKYLQNNRAYKHRYDNGKKSIWITLMPDDEVFPSISLDEIELMNKNTEAIKAACEFKKVFHGAIVSGFKEWREERRKLERSPFQEILQQGDCLCSFTQIQSRRV